MINEIPFIFRKTKLGTCVDPWREACNLPSPKESWLRNKHTGPYALLPVCRRRLTSKIATRLQLPRIAASAKATQKILRKIQLRGSGLSQSSSLCAAGDLPALSVTLSLASGLAETASGSACATPLVLVVPLRCVTAESTKAAPVVLVMSTVNVQIPAQIPRSSPVRHQLQRVGVTPLSLQALVRAASLQVVFQPKTESQMFPKGSWEVVFCCSCPAMPRRLCCGFRTPAADKARWLGWRARPVISRACAFNILESKLPITQCQHSKPF